MKKIIRTNPVDLDNKHTLQKHFDDVLEVINDIETVYSVVTRAYVIEDQDAQKLADISFTDYKQIKENIVYYVSEVKYEKGGETK